MLNYYSLMIQLEILSSRFTHKSRKRETPSLIFFSDTIADRKGFRKKRGSLPTTLFVCIFKRIVLLRKINDIHALLGIWRYMYLRNQITEMSQYG